VEARVLNKDIGFIRAGQDAEIKLETFLFTRYGTVPGKVVSVSRDAVEDEKAGPYYPVRVSLARTHIDIDGQDVPLGAGLSATVEIKTDQRRLIEYLLSPLMRYRLEGLRER
jgi:hemolysin D